MKDYNHGNHRVPVDVNPETPRILPCVADMLGKNPLKRAPDSVEFLSKGFEIGLPSKQPLPIGFQRCHRHL